MMPKQLAHYEIVEKIGAGGMGEVYRARDTKLGREVALKVLPPVVVQDRERLLRFQREAKLLASLNHPNIATLHGLEDHEGMPFLVMELIDGEDLSDRLSRGPVPVDEALRIARSVAEALASAHEQGVVHRDLKPANIKVSSAGDVKVLDFGLAKAFETDPALGDISHSPTLTAMGGTMQGVILGTAAFMSPEQARGKPIDKRTDVWAFGCVLYELLTGRQAFPGETVSDTIAKILEREPDWERLPDETPPVIQRLLRRCLVKDQKRRLRDIGDARNEIDEVTSGTDPALSGISIAVAGANNREPVRRKAPILWMTLSGVFLIAALVAAAGYLRVSRTEAPVYRSSISPEPDAFFVSRGDYAGPVVVSPDGRHLAYVARTEKAGRMLWIRDLNQTGSRAISGTVDATFPFWSADSRSIGFFLPKASSNAWRSMADFRSRFVMPTTDGAAVGPRRVTSYLRPISELRSTVLQSPVDRRKRLQYSTVCCIVPTAGPTRCQTERIIFIWPPTTTRAVVRTMPFDSPPSTVVRIANSSRPVRKPPMRPDTFSASATTT